MEQHTYVGIEIQTVLDLYDVGQQTQYVRMVYYIVRTMLCRISLWYGFFWSVQYRNATPYCKLTQFSLTHSTKVESGEGSFYPVDICMSAVSGSGRRSGGRAAVRRGRRHTGDNDEGMLNCPRVFSAKDDKKYSTRQAQLSYYAQILQCLTTILFQ